MPLASVVCTPTYHTTHLQLLTRATHSHRITPPYPITYTTYTPTPTHTKYAHHTTFYTLQPNSIITDIHTHTPHTTRTHTHATCMHTHTHAHTHTHTHTRTHTTHTVRFQLAESTPLHNTQWKTPCQECKPLPQKYQRAGAISSQSTSRRSTRLPFLSITLSPHQLPSFLTSTNNPGV